GHRVEQGERGAERTERGVAERPFLAEQLADGAQDLPVEEVHHVDGKQHHQREIAPLRVHALAVAPVPTVISPIVYRLVAGNDKRKSRCAPSIGPTLQARGVRADTESVELHPEVLCPSTVSTRTSRRRAALAAVLTLSAAVALQPPPARASTSGAALELW